MENRRHGAAKVSKPFKDKRKHHDRGDKTYGPGSAKSGYNRDSSYTSRSAPKMDSGSASGKQFRSKKRFDGPKKSNRSWKKEPPPQRIVSDRQITDGKHRGKYLTGPDSPKIKQTARRIREALFRILFRQVRAGRFLDLCAGAGTVGIEAISRGALLGTFVERSARMCTFIKKNLENCGIKEGHGEVFEMEVVPFLKKMGKRRRYWDVVYYDPPYDAEYEDVLKYFETGTAIRPGGILVIEHHSEMFFPERIGVMKRWKVVVQGETAISFYDRKS